MKKNLSHHFSRMFHKMTEKCSCYWLMSLALLSLCQAASAQTILPSDASPTCAVPAATFNSWFTSGAVTLNGAVQPADSVAFSTNSDCDFLEWGENMFLWLTSPAPAIYGGSGGLVLNTPLFFDVSTPDSMGNRTFIPITSGGIRHFMVRKAQVGPRGLPVRMNREGRMIEIEPPPARPIILDRAGNQVEVASTRFGFFGKPIFRDASGKVIKPLLGPRGKPFFINNQGNRVEMFRIIRGVGDMLTFLDAADNPIQFGEGETMGNDVLMDQHGSLVYFAIQVNDVYPYFLTGVAGGTIQATQFPSSQQDMNNITSFAQAHAVTLSDPDTMTMEIKSAWVETNGLDVSKYITMAATIPTYHTNSTTSNSTTWTTNGMKQTELALVGIHVVGTVLGHPEMVWATFEHMDNSPQAAYSYFNTSGSTTTVPQDTGSSFTWLFCSSGSSGPYNNANMTAAANDTISPVQGFTISPSDTLRITAWGVPINNNTGTFVPTELISINNSVRGMLMPGDVRANYILTGVTWTGGVPPSIPNGLYGSSEMANTTLETYQQPSNCFDCHNGTPMLGTMSTGQGIGLSHIFGTLSPLSLP
jgi:hypothetical protein